MSRYYFDVNDGEATVEDELGMDLLHADAVAGEAFGLLRDLVHDKLPEGRRVLTVRVRNGSGVLVYRGEMVVDGKRYPL